MDISLLKKLGFSDKNAKIYLALLGLGPSSVRDLAQSCDLNRGTTYDALQWLQEVGLVNYYKQDTKQLFVAENPIQLKNLVQEKMSELKSVEDDLGQLTTELQAMYARAGERPVVRYYSKDELNQILEDVLNVCGESEEKIYRIYSVEGLRKYLYENFPSFSDARVARGIKVKAFAIGAGGELRGLDERKWLADAGTTTVGTYIIIYPGKTAYISLDAKNEPIGVIIENKGVSETQQLVFDELWKIK